MGELHGRNSNIGTWDCWAVVFAGILQMVKIRKRTRKTMWLPGSYDSMTEFPIWLLCGSANKGVLIGILLCQPTIQAKF